MMEGSKERSQIRIKVEKKYNVAKDYVRIIKEAKI